MADVLIPSGRVRAVVPLLVATLVLTLASLGPAGAPRGSGTPPALAGVGERPVSPVAALAGSLSDAELVGRVLMPHVFGDHATEVTAEAAGENQAYAGVDTPAELVRRYHLGGVILFDRNVATPAGLRTFTGDLRAAAGGSLLVGIDQEYGVVARLTDGVTGLPSAMALAAGGDPALTEAAWRVAGTELAALGVNVDFAPVADVLSESSGGIIGTRSFGSDPALVSAQVAAAVRGLRSAGVAAALKHFPGHGNTDVDSHAELPVVPASHPLVEADLPPFAAGIDAGASMVMAGHLDVQQLDPGLPASFSHRVLTGLLRDQLGFEGVTVTDAMNMAPAQRWPPGEAAVRALLAGADLLLMPPDLAAAYDGLMAAVRDGTLPRERLREAAGRVLALQRRLADWGGTPADLSALDSPEHGQAVAPAAAAAVTVLRGGCSGPLVDGPVTVTAAGGRDRARGWLVEALTAAGVEVTDSGGTVVHLVGYGDGEEALREDAEVTVSMDTPYLLSHAGSPVLLATYSSSWLSLRALAAVLVGQAAAPGSSPVAVPGLPRSACDA